MSRFIYIDGVDKAAAVRFPEGYEVTSSAETGTVNLGRVEIDDPTGTIDIVPLKAAYIVETAAPAGNQRIWTGYLFNLTIDRGPYRNGPGRVWRADCVDVNFDLSRRIVLAASGSRPVETDLERLDWLLNGNLATVGIVFQGSLTNLTDNARNLDAADYRYATPMELLADMAPQCGKRAFAFYNESTAKVELFYDLADAAVNTSSSKISNVLSDAGTGVFAPFIDASLDRRGEEIASKWVLRWVGGVETQTRTDTQSTYGEHVFTSESSRIGRQTTAASHTARLLANHEAPQDTLTCTLLLPQANVNDIKEGQRLQVKFSHLPDLTAYTYRRVISRILRMDPSDQYLVQLVLDNHVQAVLGGGPPVGGFPHQTGPLTIIQSSFGLSTRTFSAAPTDGDGLVLLISNRGGAPGIPPGYTDSGEGAVTGGGDYVRGFYKTASGDSATQSGNLDQAIAYYELSPGMTLTDTQAYTGTSYGFTMASSMSVPAGGILFVIAGTGSGGGFDAGAGYSGAWTPGASLTEDFDSKVQSGHPATFIGRYSNTTSAAVPVTPSAGFLNDGQGPWPTQAIAMVFGPSASVSPPAPGQWVYGEVVATTAGVGTTQFPYASGSLIVRVDGVLISRASYTETDNTAGTFTLSWTPDTDETVTVDYQGV